MKRKFLLLKLRWLEDECHFYGNFFNPQLGFIFHCIKKNTSKLLYEDEIVQGNIYSITIRVLTWGFRFNSLPQGFLLYKISNYAEQGFDLGPICHKPAIKKAPSKIFNMNWYVSAYGTSIFHQNLCCNWIKF